MGGAISRENTAVKKKRKIGGECGLMWSCRIITDVILKVDVFLYIFWVNVIL